MKKSLCLFILGLITVFILFFSVFEKYLVLAAGADTTSPCFAPPVSPETAYPRGAPGGLVLELTVTKTHLWTQEHTVTQETGTTLILRVRFLEGTSNERARVKRVAPEWSKHANIRFEFVASEPSDIRIGFDPDNGHWSAIGTYAISLTKTMNLALRGENAERKDSVILHEFGHALGFHHEHQNPSLSVQWNEDVVIAEYKRIHNWSEDKIRRNVLNSLNRSETNFTKFDPESIMLYAIPNRWTIGDFQTDENATLSAMDKQYIGNIYGVYTGMVSKAPNFAKHHTLTLPTSEGPENTIRFLSFSPDGRMLASGVGDNYDCTIMLWDPRDSRLIRTFEYDEEITAMRFSPDSRILASANDSSEGIIVLWDPQTGRRIRTLTGHEDEIADLSFSPDGRTLASTDFDGVIMLWDPQTGRRIRTLRHENDDDPVYAVSFSPDGRMLASGDSDGVIVIWNPRDGKRIRTFKNENRITQLGFSPDGRILASQSAVERGVSDKVIVLLWDPHTGRRVRTLSDQSDQKDDIRLGGFSPDGRMLATSDSDDKLTLWDPDNGRRIRTFQHEYPVTSISFSPDGKVLAATDGLSESIILWDPDNGRRINVIAKDRYDISSISFSPDGRMLANGCQYGEIFLWDPQTGRHIRTLTGHQDEIADLSFSPDGRMLASADDDGVVMLWDPRNGRRIRTLQHEKTFFNSVSFSPNGQMLALRGKRVGIGGAHVITLWDPRKGKLLRTIETRVFGLSFRVMKFSPDSQMLALGGEFEHIILLDPHNGNHLGTFDEFSKSGEMLVDFDFSPDGQRLVSLHKGRQSDRSVYLWDPHSGKKTTSLPFKEDQKTYAQTINFSPDGQTLSVGRSFWDWHTRQYLGTAKGTWGSYSPTAFSPDGQMVATSSGYPNIELWSEK